MTKISTKKALLLSLLSMLLCVSMLVGSTFAWFTDTASASVNTIQAGTLDVALEMNNGTADTPNWVDAVGQTLSFRKASTASGEEVLWEPGCTYELPALRVVNNGNLALKYTLVVSGAMGDTELLDVIDFTMKVGDAAAVDLTDLVGILLPKGKTATTGTAEKVQYSDSIVISGHMKEEAGNAYQNKKLEGISVTVYAMQYTYEYDSTDNQYDKIDLWDGTIATAEELATATDESNKTVTVSSARLLAAVANAVNNGTTYEGYTINLTEHIDLGNIPWTPIGEKAGTKFKGTFDGGSKTIGGLNVTSATVGNDGDGDTHKNDHDGFGALFGAIEGGTVKNLTVSGTVNCDNAGGIVARMNGGTVENCVSNVDVKGARKAGGIVCNTTTTSCEIKNCTNNGKVDIGSTTNQNTPVGGIVAITNGCTIDNCTNNGEIGSANVAFSGGILGYAGGNSSVTNSTNNGAVEGTANAAGIIGIVLKDKTATINSCTNAGTISAGSGKKANICTLDGSATATVVLNGTTYTGSSQTVFD